VTQYRYAVLRHQPSLYSDEREGFAVLVEGKVGRKSLIFVVGRSPEPTSVVSDIGLAIGNKLPDIIASLVQTAVRSKETHQDVLDWVCENMAWNFHASQIETLEDQDPIYAVAFKLFSTHVAGADQLLKSIETAVEHMIRPPETMQRLGETFQKFVPVPDAEMVPA
jgi:hypothetical protein